MQTHQKQLKRWFIIYESTLRDTSALTYCPSCCFPFAICVFAELLPRWSRARSAALGDAGTSSSWLWEPGRGYWRPTWAEGYADERWWTCVGFKKMLEQTLCVSKFTIKWVAFAWQKNWINIKGKEIKMKKCLLKRVPIRTTLSPLLLQTAIVVYCMRMASRWRHDIGAPRDEHHLIPVEAPLLTSCWLAKEWDLFVLRSAFSHLLLDTGAERRAKKESHSNRLPADFLCVLLSTHCGDDNTDVFGACVD